MTFDDDFAALPAEELFRVAALLISESPDRLIFKVKQAKGRCVARIIKVLSTQIKDEPEQFTALMYQFIQWYFEGEVGKMIKIKLPKGRTTDDGRVVVLAPSKILPPANGKKADLVISLMSRPQGASRSEVFAATGYETWNPQQFADRSGLRLVKEGERGSMRYYLQSDEPDEGDDGEEENHELELASK